MSTLTTKQRPTLDELVKKKLAIEKQMESAVRRQYPIGDEVCWRHGAQLRVGTVESHGYGIDVFVRTPRGALIRMNATAFSNKGRV